jgi:hypothetical protein
MPKRDDAALVRLDRPVPVVPGQSWMHQSQEWPVLEALVTTDWANDDALVTVLVARQSPRSRKVGAATFLVDLGCLGIKNSIVRLFPSQRDYATGLRRDVLAKQAFHAADFDLVAKIVLTGEAYARSLGLSQPADAAQAKLLLAGADPSACAIPVRTGGADGKPHFISGPYDDPKRIVVHLTRRLGEGNFNYTVFVGDPLLDI